MTGPEPAPADLAPQRLMALLETVHYGRSYTLHPVTGSTNDDARAAALAGAVSGHVVVADHQARGRGSHGRNWSSPAGSDLYLSIVDRVDLPVAQLPPLTLAVGLGVAEAVEAELRQEGVPAPAQSAPPQAQVKWPNDVWLAGHKCAGILVELSSTGDRVQSLVIGVGLNVNREQFQPGLEHPATSLLRHSGRPHDRARVLAQLLKHIERQVRRFETQGPGPAIAALTPRLAFRGEAVQCGDARGQLHGVNPDGSLRVVGPAGEQNVVAGRLRRA